MTITHAGPPLFQSDFAPPSPSNAQDSANSASRWLWAAFAAYLGIVRGLNWDRSWHATHPFQSFFSPPHLFIYAFVGLTSILVLRLIVSPRLRCSFEPSVRILTSPLSLPGSLALAGGGLGLVCLGGLLDSIWHTRFGLDETLWSFPHAMLGWGLSLTFAGLLACRLTLRPYRPIAWYMFIAAAVFVLPMAAERFLGPIGMNHLPELLRRTAALPVLAKEGAFQHTVRIYLTWNLTRLSPLFVPLAALGAGAGLALIRELDRRSWLFLCAVAAATLLAADSAHRSAQYFGLAANPRSWMPLPFLPTALSLVLLRGLHLRETGAWALAGLICGAATVLVWGAPQILAISAVPAILGGRSAGIWLGQALKRPTGGAVIALLGLGILVPFLTGILDLWLRAHTA